MYSPCLEDVLLHESPKPISAVSLRLVEEINENGDCRVVFVLKMTDGCTELAHRFRAAPLTRHAMERLRDLFSRAFRHAIVWWEDVNPRLVY